MGFVVFILIVALVVMTFLWQQEKRQREGALEEYALDMLREHHNLSDGLRELREAEERTMRQMAEAVKNGGR